MTLKNKYLNITQNILMGLILLSCVSIWLPIAFMSVFMSLFMIVWLISGNYADKFARIKQNPAAVSAIALLTLYAVGISYSTTNSHAAFAFGAKYHKLLFIPMIASVLHDEKLRKLALNVFLGTSLFILALSYLKWLGMSMPEYHQGTQGSVMFKGRIAHNIFMSFAMYLMLQYSFKSIGYKKITWLALCLLAGLNILYLVDGRTGQITMLALVFWFSWETWKLKSLKYLAASIILGLGIHTIYPNFPSSRLVQTDIEMTKGTNSSAGQRLEMYTNTLSLINQHPLFGGGTGSLEHDYKLLAETKHSTMVKVTNPHNQYLLTTQELGIVGLICLLWMWLTHWRASYRLNSNDSGYALRGLVITITVGSLFNSLILDASEGQFYCVLVGVLLSAYVRQKPSETT
jgi:O-antigen ligase